MLSEGRDDQRVVLAARGESVNEEQRRAFAACHGVDAIRSDGHVIAAKAAREQIDVRDGVERRQRLEVDQGRERNQQNQNFEKCTY